MAYLDHAATTPMLPEALGGHDRRARTAWATPRRCTPPGRRARRVVEESREQVAAAFGARPGEVVFTAGGTEADNLAVKGLYWARRGADPRRAGCSSRARSSTTRCSTRSSGSATHEGAEVVWLAGRPARSGRPGRRSTRRWRATRTTVALVTVMWANNEVGTVQPVARSSRSRREHGVPVHTDAVQAVGQLPVDFAASGLDALTVTGHKLGGPLGVGALVLGRGVELDARCCTAAARSATSGPAPSTPRRSPGSPRPPTSPSAQRAERARGSAALRDELVARRARGRARRRPQRRPRPGRSAARQRALLLPRLRGRRAAACCSTRAGVECSTGSACSAGVAAAVATCCWRWAPTTSAARGVAAVLPRAHLDRRPTSTRWPRRSARSSSGPAAPGCAARPRPTVRVLAAMSGGVDSAVAAARAVDAGHDVTGVHLALSRNPRPFRTGARGCCTLEDARDARRAADVLGIPFYVWDLAERFARGRGRRLRRRVRRRAHAQPVPALQRADQVRRRARPRPLALGFDAVGTGHYARLVDGPAGPELHRAVDPAKDQSYVLGVLTARAARAGDVPARRLRQGRRSGPRRRARGLAVAQQAGQPRHLLHRRRRHRRVPAPPLGDAARGRSSTRRRGARRARGRVRLHRRPAQGLAARTGRRRTAGPATSSTSRR